MPGDDGPKDNIHPIKPKRKGKVPCTPLTVSQALQTWPELHSGRLFKLDTFSGETLLTKPILRPGVAPPARWEVTPTTDIHVTWLMELLEECGMLKVSRTTVDNAVQAEGDRNRFSAALAQLESLPAWDGVARLDNFWMEVCGAEVAPLGFNEDQVYRRIRYLGASARAFFISIVARIKRPGEKVDSVVILEGPQGGLKSTLLRVIAFDRDEWFTDSMTTSLSDNRAREHLPGRLIVELAELLSMKGSSVEGVKAFLSARDDKFRPAYGRRNVMHNRQCVFVGTTNSDRYLADTTGNRRFWPIKCGRIDIELARELMPQLYAEALVAYGDGSGRAPGGERWWLDKEVEMFAADEQEARRVVDPLEEFISLTLLGKRRQAEGRGEPTFFVSTREIQESTESGGTVKYSEATAARIGRILAKLGGINRRLQDTEEGQRRGYTFRVS